MIAFRHVNITNKGLRYKTHVPKSLIIFQSVPQQLGSFDYNYLRWKYSTNIIRNHCRFNFRILWVLILKYSSSIKNSKVYTTQNPEKTFKLAKNKNTIKLRCLKKLCRGYSLSNFAYDVRIKNPDVVVVIQTNKLTNLLLFMVCCVFQTTI